LLRSSLAPNPSFKDATHRSPRLKLTRRLYPVKWSAEGDAKKVFDHDFDSNEARQVGLGGWSSDRLSNFWREKTKGGTGRGSGVAGGRRGSAFPAIGAFLVFMGFVHEEWLSLFVAGFYCSEFVECASGSGDMMMSDKT
jgi:hypothetical protein